MERGRLEELARGAFERWGIESRARAKIDSMVGPGWDDLSNRERTAWIATVEWIKADVEGEPIPITPAGAAPVIAAQLSRLSVILAEGAAAIVASCAPANTDHAEAAADGIKQEEV